MPAAQQQLRSSPGLPAHAIVSTSKRIHSQISDNNTQHALKTYCHILHLFHSCRHSCRRVPKGNSTDPNDPTVRQGRVGSDGIKTRRSTSRSRRDCRRSAAAVAVGLPVCCLRLRRRRQRRLAERGREAARWASARWRRGSHCGSSCEGKVTTDSQTRPLLLEWQMIEPGIPRGNTPTKDKMSKIFQRTIQWTGAADRGHPAAGTLR